MLTYPRVYFRVRNFKSAASQNGGRDVGKSESAVSDATVRRVVGGGGEEEGGMAEQRPDFRGVIHLKIASVILFSSEMCDPVEIERSRGTSAAAPR